MSRETSYQQGIATSAALSYLGWLGSRAVTTGEPKIVAMSKSSGRRLKGKSSVSSGPMGDAPTNRADLRVKPPTSSDVPRGVPRNVPNQIVWDILKFNDTITTGGSIAEKNYSYALNDNPQSGNWIGLFDQWTIPQFSVSFQSAVAPGSTGMPPTLYTALDFDSDNNLASVVGIEDYSTCAVSVMEPGTRVVRTIRPCCKPVTTFSGQGLQRLWIDSATPGVKFYCIRSLCPSNAAQAIVVTITVWYAFRNQI